MNQTEDKPPFFSKWQTIYLIVFGNLILMIVLMYFFSKAFV